ncbi:DUF2955 domain-containing protein [Cetobacterium sp. 8H]|uniref:DUF2955 domain-containing protein n=1 Tax=Cetobacterium sp. 8H TaxID=2759681 RepID=UPI00163BAE85|nr:DUF2955 domain-containing protein [Cetobacterium sp. 8H]MBC2852065.1 DUF2955 domain-containing protein [Cetobacterium sp. 8H]
MFIDHTKDIIRSLLAIVLGLMFSKYITYSFNFEIPIIALNIVTTMPKFNIKIFIKNNCWLVFATALGVLVDHVFQEKFLLFYIFTFGVFFSCLYLMDKNPKASSNIVLGYSFTTIYATYYKLNMEIMVYDIFIVTVLGGILGCLILILFPKEQKEQSIQNNKSKEITHKNIGNIFLVTSIVFITWVLYIIFDIKDTFFAYATLAGIYGNINIDKIHELTPLNIGVHIAGCFLATVYSFFIIGISKFFLLFALSLSILFFPMIYFKYYGDSQVKKTIASGLIVATIMPLALYLTPFGDIASKAGARALQITTMLFVSLIITRLLIILGGEKIE